jgi:3-oxoacyl-[acyl-carrier-protein] synthase I
MTIGNSSPIMNPLRVSTYTLCSAVGAGRAAHVMALRAGTSGLGRVAFDTNDLDCWLGEVRGFDVPLTGALAEWDCRNNRLAEFALNQDQFLASVAACRKRHGASRIGVFVGTSTSGVQHTELAYRARDPGTNALPGWFDQRRTQNIYSVAAFTALRLGLDGPSMAISTACSSSAKVFAAARRAIVSGACDAAVVGGVDSLCLTTLYGFNSLQLISADICRPADSVRKGISIGEAGGFALLDPQAESPLALLGYGETSDAYHMSLPDPAGRGAIESMRAALARANVAAGDVDYINLHGTGTIANDNTECRAVCDVFGTTTPCSSTKGWTGHALGAAGMVEAAISLMAIEHGLMPRSLNTRTTDPAIEAAILLENRSATVTRVLSNSFGFGGSNCSLLFGSVQ